MDISRKCGGGDKLVMMLGALHIEDKIHQMTGKLLRDSGGTTVLSQAQVLPSGRAQSALNEHHIKRTRYAHQLSVKPGVHTNDFAPIYGRRAKKLGHASLTTVFRPSRLTFQPILRENLESPLLRYQPITTAVVTDACLNTRWHHGAYTSAASRESLGMDRVVTMYVVQSAQ